MGRLRIRQGNIKQISRNRLLLLLWLGISACRPDTRETHPPEQAPAPAKAALQAPAFNEDSAYRFVAEQVSFGPRIPGTGAHAACAAYLAGKLAGYGLEVVVQHGVVTAYNRQKFNLSNIVASYNPVLADRLLLCSHWDTRPFADRDSVDSDKPFDGANDGASGTAVLIEVGRQLALSKPPIGVDIVLFDMEDYGHPGGGNETWGLGSQYWSRNPHKPDYFARYGILLDMVGAADAIFPKEGNSVNFARGIVDRVWSLAARKGYGTYFIEAEIPPIIDDHFFISTIANIPCIDIIHYEPLRQDFMPCHHRHCDSMDIIDKRTLKAAGQVVLETVFEETGNL